MRDFLARIRQGTVLCDGAMGTMLSALPGGWQKVPEELNLRRPENVVGVHRAYIGAGAQVIETNTFGANRIKLGKAGLAPQAKELARLGASLAREAAGDVGLVAGSIGPTGKILQPLGDLAFEEARDAFAEQAAALAEGGADLLIIETMSALDEARAAIEGVRLATKLPIVCTMTFDTRLHTMMGVSPEAAARCLVDWGADVVGANCGVGPQQTEVVMERMKVARPGALLAAQPNAGLPRLVGDQAVYEVDPEEFAQYAERFARLGVHLVGGCCGSTPAHIAAIASCLAGR